MPGAAPARSADSVRYSRRMKIASVIPLWTIAAPVVAWLLLVGDVTARPAMAHMRRNLRPGTTVTVSVGLVASLCAVTVIATVGATG